MQIIDDKLLAEFRKDLLDRRKGLFDRLERQNASWQNLSRPEIEPEETGAGEQMARGVNRIDDIDRQRIQQIDRALVKVDEDRFGICETCGFPISLKRLKAVPWTPNCIRCAENREDFDRQSPPESPAASSGDQAMEDDEIRAAVIDALREDGRINLEDIDIACENGILYLEGVLPNEAQRAVLHEIIEDLLDFDQVVDNLVVDRQFAENDKSPTMGDREEKKTQDQILMEGEDDNIDIHRSLSSGEPMTPPDSLIPEKE